MACAMQCWYVLRDVPSDAVRSDSSMHVDKIPIVTHG